MKSCLVVYYSRSGTTEGVAKRIAADCACDIVRIRETRPRDGLPGYLRSIYEAITGKLPEIQPLARTPGGDELVILGTPVWAGHVSSPMRAFIVANGGRFGQVAAFCTMGGSGGDKVLDEIAALCGKPLIARLVLTDKEIHRGGQKEKIGHFTQGVAAPG
jgi:flavodoxin